MRRSIALALAVVLSGCAHVAPTAVARVAAGATALKLADYDAHGLSRRLVAVKTRPGLLPAALQHPTRTGPQIVTRLPQLGWLIVDVGANSRLTEFTNTMTRDAAVAKVSTIGLASAEDAPNDPLLPQQYGLTLGHAVEAWDVQRGHASVKIALIDTGVDTTHPDLAPKLDPASWSVFDHTNNPHDEYGHGTHTAGIAAAIANNAEGGAGVAPGAGLLSVKVLDNAGHGNDATVAEGIVYAADHGAKVMSLSLGFYRHSPVLEDALQYALDHDVVVVASAGNNNEENDPATAPHLPSTYPGVIEVAATDKADQKASFSNFGKTVSVAAPGVDVLSTLPTYEDASTIALSYGVMSGTSMAAPYVAGVAALVRSQFPALTQAQVKARIEATADDLGAAGPDPIFGHGRVNALAAVKG